MQFLSSTFKYLTASNLSSNAGEGLCIQLERKVPVYFAGETITGRVIVTYAERKEFKNLSILFEGRAKVHWTKTKTRTVGFGDTRRTESYTKHYRAEENYFSTKLMLLTNPSGVTVTTPAGTSYYPFYFTLPLNLPTSYNSSTGKVMYSMTARFKKAWYKFDVTAVVPFTVNGILDLNREVGASERITASEEKFICCWPCKSGPIGLNLVIHRSGFVPGEIIPFTAEMNNVSKREITLSRIKLLQNVTYYAQGKSKSESHTLCRVTGPSLRRGESKTWRDLESIRIPPCPPTKLAGCNIIDVQYILEFRMVASGLATDLKTSQRIVVGTIPLRAFFAGLMPSDPIPQGLPTYPQPAVINPPYNPSFPAGPKDIPSAPPPAEPYSKEDEAAGSVVPSAPSPPPFGLPQPDHNSPWTVPGPSGEPSPHHPPQPAAPVPSAPVFQDYPDLPPPSYGDIMGGGPNSFFTSGSTGNCGSDDPPPTYDMANDDNFVPTYVRYGWNRQPPPAP